MTNILGANRTLYKKRNRGLLLKLLMTGQCSSRIELSKAMGLSKMAITNIVNELISTQILVESERDQNLELGRNPVLLKLSDKAPKVIGLLIFRDRCQAVLCDLQLNVLKKETIRYEALNKKQLLEHIEFVIDSVFDSGEKVVGIGVSSISPIDIKSGVIINPKFFYDITDIHIVALLEKKYHLPIYFNNDNQNGALAEKLFGNGQAYHDILLVGMGEGVGCGVIAKDSLFLSSRQLIPEFGHVSIDYKGNPCFCGNKGCIETYIGTNHLTERYRIKMDKAITFKDLCEETDNPFVDAVLLDAMDKLAGAICNILNVMNTELVILGHEGVFIPNKYLDNLRTLINEQRFARESIPVEVVKPHFMEDTQLLGAACGIIDQVFCGNHLFE